MQAVPAQWAGMILGGQSFPRSSRLLNPAQFRRVFERAVVSKDRYFRVMARPAEGAQARSRLGIAVSRKVEPGAAGRNRIKRVIRESFRLAHPVRPKRQGEARKPERDYVVLAAPPSATAQNAVLRESLAMHWQKIDRKLADAAQSTDEPGPTLEEKA